jgi:hypothetical protein
MDALRFDMGALRIDANGLRFDAKTLRIDAGTLRIDPGTLSFDVFGLKFDPNALNESHLRKNTRKWSKRVNSPHLQLRQTERMAKKSSAPVAAPVKARKPKAEESALSPTRLRAPASFIAARKDARPTVNSKRPSVTEAAFFAMITLDSPDKRD